MLTNLPRGTDYVSLASLIVSMAAAVFAALSVLQAKRMARREHDEWAQRRWFDLYSKTAEALDTLEYFRVRYPDSKHKGGTEERAMDWSEMMFKIRAAGRMAFAFPQNPLVTAFIDSCKFRNSEDTVLDEGYEKMFEAVEGLRGKALVNLSVLDYDPKRKS